MSRYDDFMDDPAFLRAVRATRSCLDIHRDHADADPDAVASLVAMATLSAFANADGLTEPHVVILARFAPDRQRLIAEWFASYAIACGCGLAVPL